MRTLALALLLALSGSVAALAQQDPSFYTDRAYQWRRDHPDASYNDPRAPWNQGRSYEDRRSYDNQRSYNDRNYSDRRDAERQREEQAYERGRRDAEQNSGGSGNDIMNSIGRMFNNR